MTHPTWLYRAYGADDVLLYIGVTGDVATRLRTHSRNSDWYSLAVRVETQSYATRRLALDAEYNAIHDEKPLHNATPKGSRLPLIVERSEVSA